MATSMNSSAGDHAGIIIGFATALILAVDLTPLPSIAAGQAEIHYTLRENLERSDADRATGSTDVAAYVPTDRPVIDTLIRANARGVAVRLLPDPSRKTNFAELAALANDPNVDKRSNGV